MSSATKVKYAKQKKTGGGAVEWTDVDEIVTEIVGKLKKISLSRACVAGKIDPGDNLQFKPVKILDATSIQKKGTPVKKTERQRYRAFQ